MAEFVCAQKNTDGEVWSDGQWAPCLEQGHSLRLGFICCGQLINNINIKCRTQVELQSSASPLL